MWHSRGITRDSQTQSRRRRLRDLMADARTRILKMFRAPSGRGRGKMSLCALFAPVPDASLQHKNCLGRQFGKRPLISISIAWRFSIPNALHFTHQEAGITGLFNPVLPCQNFRNEADQNFRNGNRQLPALALAKSCRIRMIAVLPRSFKPTARSGRLTDFRAEPRKQTNLFSIRSAGCQD
jgi:hypothetical protein